MTAPVLFPLAIAVLAVAYGIAAFGFPRMELQEGFGPGLFPGIIACLVALLALSETLAQVARHRRRDSGSKISATGVSTSDRGLRLDDFTNAAIVTFAVIATVIAIPLIGFVPAGSAIVFALCILMGARPIWKGLVIAIATSGAIYLIFSKGFNVLFAF